MGENTVVFLSSFLKAATPMITNYISGRIDSGLRENQHKRDLELLQKQEEILNKQLKSSNHQIHQTLPNIPKFRFEENEDVDELGNRMWNETHKATLAIPEDARPHEVKKVMRQIESSFKNHPCSECKEHARENLRKVPLVNGVTTKHEAVERLYEFHNEVNNMLDKPEFTRNDFQRQYGYAL